jgi:NADH:ubiquinone oxidoreductase subunit H
MKWYELNILDYYLIAFNKYIGPCLYELGFIDWSHQVSNYVIDFCYDACPSLLLKYASAAALVVALKFILLIALLVFIRGGVPRYRYDFLTKIGWIKFLSLVIAVFLSSFLLIVVI